MKKEQLVEGKNLSYEIERTERRLRSIDNLLGNNNYSVIFSPTNPMFLDIISTNYELLDKVLVEEKKLTEIKLKKLETKLEEL